MWVAKVVVGDFSFEFPVTPVIATPLTMERGTGPSATADAVVSDDMTHFGGASPREAARQLAGIGACSVSEIVVMPPLSTSLQDLRPPELKIPRRHGRVYNPVSFRAVPSASLLPGANVAAAAAAGSGAAPAAAATAAAVEPRMRNGSSGTVVPVDAWAQPRSTGIARVEPGNVTPALLAPPNADKGQPSLHLRKLVLVTVAVTECLLGLAMLLVTLVELHAPWEDGFELCAAIIALFGVSSHPCQRRCCTALHCTALHCTALHCTALHCTALHCTADA
jgi:hypothetical protein